MLRILAAWNAAGWLYIALLGVMMVRCEVAGIRQQASLEDESRSAILVLTVLASAATMVAVGRATLRLEQSQGRMIHQPSGKPIKYLKGIETEQGFEEVPEEEIIKGYEHTKGHHVLIEPQELDALKLEAKHTIDMKTFVDLNQVDSRYFEKPYYLLPDGDEADEGYTVLRDAFAKTKKVAIGQLIMHGREHLVGITGTLCY